MWHLLYVTLLLSTHNKATILSGLIPLANKLLVPLVVMPNHYLQGSGISQVGNSGTISCKGHLHWHLTKYIWINPLMHFVAHAWESRNRLPFNCFTTWKASSVKSLHWARETDSIFMRVQRVEEGAIKHSSQPSPGRDHKDSRSGRDQKAIASNASSKASGTQLDFTGGESFLTSPRGRRSHYLNFGPLESWPPKVYSFQHCVAISNYVNTEWVSLQKKVVIHVDKYHDPIWKQA